VAAHIRPYFGFVPGTMVWTHFWPTSHGSTMTVEWDWY